MNKLVSILLVGILSFGGNWLLSVYRGVPVPQIHDEFSYLLAADTFAHGRITNPSHPFWEHFETFHELQQPTYMSKYPPAQGFIMAVGQVLGGHPIYGVWLSAALMCMAICWMLYAWMPPQWAFIGGLVSTLQFGVFTYWSQSYWGGAVAAMGGALVFGALPRIFEYQRLRDVIWLGLGIAVLVNSRPFEGIFIGIPVGCLALPWKIKWDKIKDFHFVKKIVLPLVLILLIIAMGVGAYNRAVTGKVALFPYKFYLMTQMEVPLFIWQPLHAMPSSVDPTIRDFERRLNNKYFLQKKTWRGFWEDEKNDVGRIFRFYFGYILAIPAIYFLLRRLHNGSRIFKFFLIVLVVCCTCAVMTYRAQVHYFSSFTSLAVLLVVLGLRTLADSFEQNGMKLVYVLIAVQLLINISAGPQPPIFISYGSLAQGQGLDISKSYSREEFKNVLMQKGGKHLVLVRYASQHLIFNEWVFNGADIDRQPIVWARSINEQEDARLIDYFKDRQVWRITINNQSSPRRSFEQR